MLLFSLSLTEENFIKKLVKLEQFNRNPKYFRQKILDSFPELSAVSNVFSLWQLKQDTNELIPLPKDFDNSEALFRSKIPDRSNVFIRAVSVCTHNIASCKPKDSCSVEHIESLASATTHPYGVNKLVPEDKDKRGDRIHRHIAGSWKSIEFPSSEFNDSDRTHWQIF